MKLIPLKYYFPLILKSVCPRCNHEEEFFLDGPKGTYAFDAESLYRKDYFGDHSLNFNDNFSFVFEWAYPWYFTVFEDSIEVAGEEFLKYFLEDGLWW